MKNDKVAQRQAILQSLGKTPSTISDLAVEMRLSIDTIRNRMKELKNGEKVHVSGWERHEYSAVKIYSAGKGQDIPMPSLAELKKMTNRLSDEYRKKPKPKNKDEVLYRKEFFDHLVFKVVTSRTASC